ncbi:hypothetical protein L1049_004900 [Liquidambar formosana]|uniref:Uncharacterized protein n=1 Tax=Liquidambar formosana TaxID=63359 RepID=A0AAP0RTU3_LIQFO
MALCDGACCMALLCAPAAEEDEKITLAKALRPDKRALTNFSYAIDVPVSSEAGDGTSAPTDGSCDDLIVLQRSPPSKPQPGATHSNRFSRSRKLSVPFPHQRAQVSLSAPGSDLFHGIVAVDGSARLASFDVLS